MSYGPAMSASLPAPNELVGPYKIDSLIGEGGFGAVYRATHVDLQTAVAVKVLKPELSSDPECRARFLREIRAIAKCAHPGIVRVLDAGDEAWLWMAMELLDGEELTERIYRSAPLKAPVGMELGADLAEAVAAAHAHGVIHRDLKPENVFLAKESGVSRLKILDFGIAKVIRPADGLTLMTKTGQAMGTPVYMAPEQFLDSSRVDERTDVYSIGAVLFELFARRTPFDAPTVPQIVVQVMREGPPPLGAIRRDLPQEVCALVHKAMAMNPAQRFQSAGELCAALRSWGQESSTMSPVVELGASSKTSSESAFANTTMAESPAHDAAIEEAVRRSTISSGYGDVRPTEDGLRTHSVEGYGARSTAPDDRLWTPLSDGRWTLVDRFDQQGHRYYVAVDNDPSTRELRGLSSRERDVARLAGLGYANKAIAYDLSISESSVATYLQRALEKIGLERIELPLIFEESARTITWGDARLLVSRHMFQRRSELTDAEQDVAEMAARGRSDVAIAEARTCAPRTIANQLRQVYRKLGVANRNELVRALVTNVV